MNVLFINQPTSEYGQSLLYHGFTKLGHNIVAAFPNTFHFNSLENCDMNCSNEQSNCRNIQRGIGCLNHPAHLDLPKSIESEKWDLVLTNNGYGNEVLHRKLYDAGVPIIALDLGDSEISSYNAWCQVVDGLPHGFFRREYVKGQEGFPLSYSFYKDKSIFKDISELNYSVSSMFRPTNPTRASLNNIALKMPNSYVGTPKYTEYLEVLSRSKFAFSTAGAGWDTLRYWEIAGRGSVIVTPHQNRIVINNDFTDGENCIKYASYEELFDKIDFYLKNENEYVRLREASWAHFNEFHTTEARAQELLNRVGL